jgi:hypothetical protein
MMRWSRFAACLALAGGARALGAQRTLVQRGDSLLRAGNAAAAESYYYAAARERPRDPAARLALGRYLAARGALKVGAVLMEEARFFGGDAREVAASLAPVYVRLGDFRALSSLPSSPLGPAERARAEWLRGNSPAASGPDSTTLAYVPGDSGAVGRVTITVGTTKVEALLDPATQGLVLDRSLARELKSFGDDRAAVVPSLRVGGLALANVPARVAALDPARPARVGLDLLADLSPTFDVAARRLTLRRARLVKPAEGERLQTLFFPTGAFLVRGGRVRPFAAGDLRAVARWTLDGRRGEVVVAR